MRVATGDGADSVTVQVSDATLGQGFVTVDDHDPDQGDLIRLEIPSDMAGVITIEDISGRETGTITSIFVDGVRVANVAGYAVDLPDSVIVRV